jgi:hypothetical protein
MTIYLTMPRGLPNEGAVGTRSDVLEAEINLTI